MNRTNFPGDPVVKSLPANAGDADSIPDREMKIPCAGATKPVCRDWGAHATMGRMMQPNK